MSAALLSEAERILRKHSPADFDNTIDAFPESIEYVRGVEDAEAWRNGYGSLDDFYAAHEPRHPRIRVYSEARREIETADFSAPPEAATQRLERLWRNLNPETS